jgi:predicted DCC family thiol-disulfide oxidoreductase YuxK
VVLFDGVCALCNGTVNFLMRIDHDRVLRYAPLQGTTAEELRAAHPEIPRELETVVLVDDGVVFLRMKAASRLARYLRWPWKAAYVSFWLPAWLTDPVYRLIARMRYRLFGKHDVCRIPAPHERDLFLP